jgi:F-type H+-transporting ATPase subunit a
VAINWSGKRRWIALILLIAGVVVMLKVPPVIPVIQLPGEKYPAGWSLFGLQITNSLMGSILVWLIIIGLILYVNSRRPKSGAETPRGGFYNFFELLFEGLYNFIEGIAGGPQMRYIFSFFMTIFIIVLLSNWIELVPGVDSIGFLEPHVEVNAQTGQRQALAGYETYPAFGGYALNGKCPWVNPEQAATFTDEQRQARKDNGCVTGTTAPAAAAATANTTTTEGASTTTGATTTEPVAQAQETEQEIAPGDPAVPWVVLPFVRAPSTDLNMTAGLALIAVVMTQVLGFKVLGPGYLTKFFNFKTLFTSPLGGIDVAVGLLELIGEFAKILSFSFRLLGNVFAGSVLLFVMSKLLTFLPWPFFILEFFVGAIQAVVFGLLAAIFMSQATAGHHGGDEEHAAEHAS